MIHKTLWKYRSIALALAVHSLLFLWVFVLRLPPQERPEIGTHPGAGSLLSLPQRIIEERGLHWLPVLLWNGNREVGLYWGLSQLCLKGDATYFLEEKGVVPEAARPRPYRDVPVEYPPFGLLSIAAPALVSKDLDAYAFWFSAWSGILFLANLLMGLYLVCGGPPPANRVGRALWWSAGFLVLFGNVAAARLDHFVVTTMMLAGLVLHRAMKEEGGKALLWMGAFGFMVSVGVLTKIVPGLVLIAGLLVLRMKHGGAIWRSRVWAALAGFASGLGLLSVFFYAALGHGYLSSLTYHVERGIQAESFYAGILMLAHLAGMPLSLEHSYRSWNLATPLTDALKATSAVVMIGLIALTIWRVWRVSGRSAGRPPGVSSPGFLLTLLTTILLLAFMVSGKVFSPQFMLWPAPFMAALAALREDMRLPGRLFLVATLLTQLVFPILWDLLSEFHPAAVVLLNMRNFILGGVWILLLYRLPRYLKTETSLSLRSR